MTLLHVPILQFDYGFHTLTQSTLSKSGSFVAMFVIPSLFIVAICMLTLDDTFS